MTAARFNRQRDGGGGCSLHGVKYAWVCDVVQKAAQRPGTVRILAWAPGIAHDGPADRVNARIGNVITRFRAVPTELAASATRPARGCGAIGRAFAGVIRTPITAAPKRAVSRSAAAWFS